MTTSKKKKKAKARKIKKDQEERYKKTKWNEENKLQNFLNKYRKEIIECIYWLNRPDLYVWSGLVNHDGTLVMSKEKIRPPWHWEKMERQELKKHMLEIGVPPKWFDDETVKSEFLPVPTTIYL